MSLTLHFHPLASFCWKALIALYENDTAFQPVIVDLGDAASRNAFTAIWPMAKMPVLVDGVRGDIVAESTIVIDYLDAFHPGATRFVPDDPDTAWKARMWDRLFDNYVQEPMQKIVLDNLRPQGSSDPFGVEQAKTQLRDFYGFADRELAGRRWAAGDAFSLADCSAAPALFYANTALPFETGQTSLRAYFDRLMARPSVRRVLREAEPYFGNVPLPDKPTMPAAASAGS